MVFKRVENGIVVIGIEDFQKIWGSKAVPQDIKAARKIGPRQYFVSNQDLEDRLNNLYTKRGRLDEGIESLHKILQF